MLFRSLGVLSLQKEQLERDTHVLVLKTCDLHLPPRRLDSPSIPYFFRISEDVPLNLGLFPQLRRGLNSLDL